jgi:hypothetical protein
VYVNIPYSIQHGEVILQICKKLPLGESSIWHLSILLLATAYESTIISRHKAYLKVYKKLYKPGAGGSCYNPSYSGGRDQEDGGLKPAWQIVPKILS